MMKVLLELAKMMSIIFIAILVIFLIITYGGL